MKRSHGLDSVPIQRSRSYKDTMFGEINCFLDVLDSSIIPSGWR
jgi:hypothetical protein